MVKHQNIMLYYNSCIKLLLKFHSCGTLDTVQHSALNRLLSECKKTCTTGEKMNLCITVIGKTSLK